MKLWPFVALLIGFVLPGFAADKGRANQAKTGSGPVTSLVLEAVGKDEGIASIPSTHSVDQTVDKLQAILKSKGVAVFALVDHSGGAAKVGLKMPPAKVLIFGNPKAGTPLMLAAPLVALELPMKILIWEDSQGKVWLSYNTPAYLKERYSLPQELLPNIAVIETLAAKAAE